MIYGFVFGSGERELNFGCLEYETEMQWYSFRAERYTWLKRKLNRTATLLRACRSIYTEAVKVLYDQTRFEVLAVRHNAYDCILPAFIEFPLAALVSNVYLRVIVSNPRGMTDAESARIS